MIFGKWEGVLCHENLKDIIVAESFSMEIFPGEGKTGEDKMKIRASIIEEIADDKLSPPHKTKKALFRAFGNFCGNETRKSGSKFQLKYQEKDVTIEGEFSPDDMEIRGNYIFREKGQSEITMTLKLSPR